MPGQYLQAAPQRSNRYLEAEPSAPQQQGPFAYAPPGYMARFGMAQPGDPVQGPADAQAPAPYQDAPYAGPALPPPGEGAGPLSGWFSKSWPDHPTQQAPPAAAPAQSAALPAPGTGAGPLSGWFSKQQPASGPTPQSAPPAPGTGAGPLSGWFSKSWPSPQPAQGQQKGQQAGTGYGASAVRQAQPRTGGGWSGTGSMATGGMGGAKQREVKPSSGPASFGVSR